MKRTILFLMCVIGIVNFLFAQNNCPFGMRVNLTPGTCYDNCTVTIHLIDAAGNDLDTLGTDLSSIRYHYKSIIGLDTTYYTTNNVLTLSVGQYQVGVEAICHTGLEGALEYKKLDTTVTITTTSSYITPVASIFSIVSNSSSIPTTYGNIPTLPCKNTGRIQLKIKNGTFPYTVVVLNRTTGDTVREVVFNTYQNNGTDSTRYNYKYYYTFDSLAAGKYLFKISDACGYHLPDIWQEITIAGLPEITFFKEYSFSKTLPIVFGYQFFCSATDTNANYSSFYRNMWQYRTIVSNTDGQVDTTSWKTANYNYGTYSWSINQYYKASYDTINIANSYCNLFTKTYTIQLRRINCRDTAISFTTTINNPAINTPSISMLNLASHDTVIYNLCNRINMTTYPSITNYTYYYPYDRYRGSSYRDYYYRLAKFIKPLKVIFKNNYTPGDTIYQTKVDNPYMGAILNADSVMSHYDTSYLRTPYQLYLKSSLVDSTGCILSSRDYNLTYKKDTVTSSTTSNYTWTGTYYNSGEYCCRAIRGVYIYRMYQSQILDSTTVRLIQSPLNNKYNYTATYYTATGWHVSKDSLSNIATISFSGSYIYLQDYCLPSGRYIYDIQSPCGHQTITITASFNDTYSWESTRPIYKSTIQCTEMYIKPSAGAYKMYTENTSTTTGLPTESSTNIKALFQIISGPSGGYSTTVIDTTGTFRVTMPGRYIIQMYSSANNSSAYCSPAIYKDTLYFNGGTVEFKYAYAYVCDSTSTTGQIRVKGINGTLPYSYTVYSGPNKTGTILGSNSTGIFDNIPLRLNQVVSIEIKDGCNASFSINQTVFELINSKKAWFDGNLRTTYICEGTEIEIYGISLGDDVTYTWTGPNGFHQTTQQTDIYAPRNEGTGGWYHLLISNTGCGAPITDSIYLNFIVAPSITIEEDTTVCPGASVTLRYTPHGSGSITYTIGQSSNSINSYQTYTGSEGITQTFNYTPYSNTYFWVNSVANNICQYIIPEDTILIRLKPHTATNCDLVISNDTICYDSSAVLSAYSTLDYPQYIHWYSDSLQLHYLTTDTLMTNSDESTKYFASLQRDTTMFITVSTEDYCEAKAGTTNSYLNMQSGTSTMRCGEAIRFYDSGGASGNYGNMENIKHTFSSNDGTPITLTFSLFNTSDTLDRMYIFSGTSTNSDSLIAKFGGNLTGKLPKPITSKGNSLTIWFLSNGQINQVGWDAVIGAANGLSKGVVQVKTPLHAQLSSIQRRPIHYNTAVDFRAIATGGRGDQYHYQWFTSTDQINWTSRKIESRNDTSLYESDLLTVPTYFKVIVQDASPTACDGSDTAIFFINVADIELSLDLSTPSRRSCDGIFNASLVVTNSGNQSATNVVSRLHLPAGLSLLSPSDTIFHIDTLHANSSITFPLSLQVRNRDTIAQTFQLKSQIWDCDQGDRNLNVDYGDWNWIGNPRQVDEDSIRLFVPRSVRPSVINLVANHLQQCSNHDAIFTASSAITPPAYYKWYSNAQLSQLIFTDTISGTDPDISSYYTIANLTKDTTLYITVESEEVCPYYEFWTSRNIVNATDTFHAGEHLRFYDSQGPSANYLNYEDYTYTLIAPENSTISITVNSYAGESCCDYLRLYDVVGTTNILLTEFRNNSATASTYTTTSNKMTITFHSDLSVVGAGWDALIQNSAIAIAKTEASAIVWPRFDQNEIAAICTTELPYTWRDTTFDVGTISGNYIFHRSTVNGCDSIVTLALSVYPAYNQNESVTICSEELPYQWRDTTFDVGTISGNYIFHKNTTSGCDSTVTLQLTVNQTYEETTLTRKPIITCNPSITIGDSVFTYNHSLSKVVFHTIHGCDSTILVAVAINNVSNPDYHFSITCPPEIFDTLPNTDCSMPVNLGTYTIEHHVTDILPSYIDSIAVTNNAPTIYTPGDYTITWMAKDSCGNIATCQQLVHVAYSPCPKATDFDNNVYEAVRIDCDCWTKTNLTSLHYSDGRAIGDVYSYHSDVYPNTDDNISKFGRLYSWYAAMDTTNGILDNGHGHIQGICPAGWYMPSEAQYTSIARFGASALKSSLYWLDGGGTNTTGFNALPAGYYDNSTHGYYNLMGNAYFWSTSFLSGSSSATSAVITHHCDDMIINDSSKGLGYSIRCILEKQ